MKNSIGSDSQKFVRDETKSVRDVILAGPPWQVWSAPSLEEIAAKEAKEGQWLQIEIRDGELYRAEMDQRETTKRRQRIAEKLERLRRREHRKSSS